MEEEISSDLKLTALKQASLCKAFERLRSEASAMHLLSLHWRDLNDHFDSARSSLDRRLGELVERETIVAAREKSLEAKDSEIESKSQRLAEIQGLIEERETEMESKLKRLDEVERLIEERGREIESKAKSLDEIERLIEERGRETESKSKRLDEIEWLIEVQGQEFEGKERDIESKAKRLDEIERLIEEKGKVVELNKLEAESLESSIQEKRYELGSVEKWMKEKERDQDRLRFDIRERAKRLDSLERTIRQRSEEAESMDKEVGLARGMLKDCRDDLDYKERQFHSIQMSLEDSEREFVLKEDRIRACQNFLHELEREIRAREELLHSIQDSIVECSVQLESKKEQLEEAQQDFDLKKKIFVSLKNSASGCVNQYDTKERQSDGLVLKPHKVKEQSLGPKFEEIHSIHKKVDERLKEVEFKENNLLSFQRLVEDRAIGLERRERQFEERVNELAMRQREHNLTFCSRVKVEQSDIANFPSFASYQHCTTNGHFLLILLTEQLKSHNLRCSELFAVLQGSPDPARLVLDAIQGFNPLHSGSPETGFDLNFVRTSCILLLEKLMMAKPKISPRVREEAIKLASDWKAKMTAKTENHLEIVGFLQLIACYRLESAFDREETRKLVDLIGQNRQESPFSRALCFADKAHVKTEDAENPMDIVPCCPKLTAKDLTREEIFAALQMPDPAKHVLGIMNESFFQLWKKRDHVGFDASLVNGYIFIFEQLLRSSAEIQTVVKEDAMKLAIEWGDRIRASETEKSLEALGFLLFLAAYGLVSSFSQDSVASFLEIISLNRRLLEESRTLGLAYKIDVLVQNLIGRKKHVAAVRLACTFKITDKFSPVKLLTEHVEEAKRYSSQLCDREKSVKEKDELTDREISSLRDVVQCVKDYNLASEYSTDNLTKQIGLLEKIKRDRRDSALFFQAAEENQQPVCNKRKKRKNSASSEQEEEQTNTKCLNTGVSTAKPCESPSPASKPVPCSTTKSLTVIPRESPSRVSKPHKSLSLVSMAKS